jgi:hypothetical protein
VPILEARTMTSKDVASDCAAAMHGVCSGTVPSWDAPVAAHACQCPCHALAQVEMALPVPRQLGDTASWAARSSA